MTALAPDGLGPTLCIGEILVEIVATTQGCGFVEAQAMTGPYPSGAPAIFIDQCGRIGGRAAMVGAVGNDDFGRVNLARLSRDSVDISSIAVDPDLPTGSAFVRYRPDGARDFVFNIAHSAAARIAWTAEVAALAGRAGHLHVMGTGLTMKPARSITSRAADMIKSRGGTLSLDPNLRKELRVDEATQQAFARILSMADLLLPSGEELEAAAGIAGEKAALHRLFSLGIKEIALKRGDRGASVFTPTNRIDAPGFAVREVDPTGAGDCFGGAYVACRRLGMPVAQSLTYANAAGARNVTFRGPMEGAGTLAELDEFITNTPVRAGD
jgi:tagatose kinase